MTDQTTDTTDGTTQSTADSTTATTTGGDTAPLLQAQPGDWLPEKHRTFKEGTQDLDIEASARKLADAHRSLEKRLGQGGFTVPATADDYKIEGLNQDINFDEVRKDPMFAAVLKDAHAAGISNESMNFFMQRYFNDIAPNLLSANAQLTVEEARAELSKAWGDEATMTKNLAAANRAFNGFASQGEGTGSTARLIEKFGTDPDFLAFAAAVGAEMSEDTPITEGSQSAEDWQGQVDAIMKELGELPPGSPKREGLLAKKQALYDKRYSQTPNRLGGTAIR